MGIGVERGRLLASLHPPPINVRKPVVRHHIFGTVSSWKAKWVSWLNNWSRLWGRFYIRLVWSQRDLHRILEAPWVFFISPIFENTQVLLQCRFWTRESNRLSSDENPCITLSNLWLLIFSCKRSFGAYHDACCFHVWLKDGDKKHCSVMLNDFLGVLWSSETSSRDDTATSMNDTPAALNKSTSWQMLKSKKK